MITDYHEVIGFIKKLRAHLKSHYKEDYFIGDIYYGTDTITYFPFTPKTIKSKKLKIAIVYNHKIARFEIWLAGQNKNIQKEYWTIFRESDWNKYPIPDSTDDGFSIVDFILAEKPDFRNIEKLLNEIESGSLDFIREIENVLN